MIRNRYVLALIISNISRRNIRNLHLSKKLYKLNNDPSGESLFKQIKLKSIFEKNNNSNVGEELSGSLRKGVLLI